MKNFQYTITSDKFFDDAVSSIEQKTTENGFRVLHTHDVAGALAEKGFVREPVKIIEICNARYANEALNKDMDLAVMLPCPIAVYSKQGKTFISTMLPSALAEFYPASGIKDIANAVESVVLEIIDKAK